MSNGELAHYGIKGMRWGKRKQSDGSYDDSGKPARSKAARRAEASSMSDQELRAKINRMQMEKQYVDLTAPSTVASRQVNKGREFVQGIGVNVLRTSVTTIATAVVTGVVRSAISSRYPDLPLGKNK